MMAQYSEGLPGLVDEEGRQFVRTGTDEFEQACYLFYEQFLAMEEGPATSRIPCFRWVQKPRRLSGIFWKCSAR